MLVLAVIFSFALSLSLHELITAFDDRCLLHAKLEFEKQASADSLSSAALMSAETGAKYVAKISDFFNSSYAEYLEADAEKDYPVEQLQALQNCKKKIFKSFKKKIIETFLPDEINDRKTVWGKKSTCDFGVYIPISQSLFGIIMAVMFVICGKGGKSDSNSFLPQPWRIVTPAIVFFVIMTSLSIANLAIIQGGMNDFCESFNKILPDVGCTVAMNRYMDARIEDIKLTPGMYYKLVTSFNYTTFGCWLLSLLVLVARIVFVVDFQLVKVSVKTIEFERAEEESKFKVSDAEDETGRRLTTTKC